MSFLCLCVTSTKFQYDHDQDISYLLFFFHNKKKSDWKYTEIKRRKNYIFVSGQQKKNIFQIKNEILCVYVCVCKHEGDKAPVTLSQGKKTSGEGNDRENWQLRKLFC